MLQTNTISRLPDQSVNTVKPDEWLTVLADAVDRGLVPQNESESIRARNLLSLLEGEKLPLEVNRVIAAGPAAEMALNAIAPLFQPCDVVELDAICPAGGGRLSLSGRLDDDAQRRALVAFVREHSGSRNIYAGVNPRKALLAGTGQTAKGGDIAGRHMTVLDFDDKDAPADDPKWERTIAALVAGANPALVVDSGNGHHVWLPITGADTPDTAASATPALAAMMQDIGADNMSDLPRVARLPFTPNLPTANKRARGNVVCLAKPMNGFVAQQGGDIAVPTVDALCANIADVKAHYRLPGKATSAANAKKPTSAANAGRGRKTGWPAPSAEALRMALEFMPNDDGTFDRNEWVAVAYSARGAALGLGIAAEAGEWFMEFCERYPRNDPAESRKLWDEQDAPMKGWGGLMAILEAKNPAGADQVKAFVKQTAFDSIAATNVAVMGAVSLTPARLRDATAQPPRAWLYKPVLVRGDVTVTVGPGGTGKSALVMAEALALATGRTLFADMVPHKKLTVWYHTGEDSTAEQKRRLAAAMLHYGLTDKDIGDRLILTSGTRIIPRLAQRGTGGPELTPGAIDGLSELIRQYGVDILILDPLAATHSLDENANSEMNVLMAALGELSEAANISVHLIHHTSKAAGNDIKSAGTGASRGASAITDAARIVRTLDKVKEGQASDLQIPIGEHWRFIAVSNTKANLAPIAAGKGFELVGVPLDNGTPDYPDGDTVQTARTWTIITKGELGAITDAERADVQRTILHAGADSRKSHFNAKGWIGYLVAEALGLSLAAPGTPEDQIPTFDPQNRARVKAILAAGKGSGWLEECEEYCRIQRKQKPHIRVVEIPQDEKGDAGDNASAEHPDGATQ